VIEADVENDEAMRVSYDSVRYRCQIVGVQIEYPQLPIGGQQVARQRRQVVATEAQLPQLVQGRQSSNLDVQQTIVLDAEHLESSQGRPTSATGNGRLGTAQRRVLEQTDTIVIEVESDGD